MTVGIKRTINDDNLNETKNDFIDVNIETKQDVNQNDEVKVITEEGLTPIIFYGKYIRNSTVYHLK